jgi:hypothetical protein
MSKSPPREYFYVIDVAEECFDVAEGDLGRAATLFRQIMPDADEDLWQAMLEYLLKRASKQIQFTVHYRGHLNLDQPALRTELRAHVVKILRENKNNPESPMCYEGEIELAGAVHSFCLVVMRVPTAIHGTDERPRPLVARDQISLWVLAGSVDDIDAAILAIEPGDTRGYVDHVDQVSLSD